MSVIKGLGYLGAAAAGVLVIRLGLDLAVADLSNADRASGHEVADARRELPSPRLAPAMTHDPEPSTDAPLEAATWEDTGFGTPDPEFGRGNPALGEPAWGAREGQRQPEAAAEIVPPS